MGNDRHLQALYIFATKKDAKADKAVRNWHLLKREDTNAKAVF